MFTEVLEGLKTGIENIDILLNQRVTRRKNFDQSRGASWRLDEELKTCINNIKGFAENLAKTCIKFVLVATKRPTEAVLKSIVDELKEFSNGFIVAYFNFLNHSVSDCLFDYVSKIVRVMLTYIQQLALDVSVNNFENVSVTAGMIDKLSEEAKKLPLANRLAYRRYIMERCAVLKDTVKEFDEYVAAHKEKQAAASSSSSSEVPETVFNGMNKLSMAEKDESEDDDDDDEGDEAYDAFSGDEEEEDEVDYTAEEAAAVEKCIGIMKSGYETVKLVLSAITVVSDNITTAITAAESIGAVSEELLEVEARGMEWVASLSKLSNNIQDQATDLGAELYPPFAENLDASVQPLATILLGTVGMTLDLMAEETFRPYQTNELSAAISNLASTLPLTVSFA